MRLLLSTYYTPFNVKFSDSETGQVMYKVSTKGYTTTITRVTPSDDPGDTQDHFKELAQIEHLTTLKMADREIALKEFFRTDGNWNLAKARNRLWTASDGRTYVWKIEATRTSAYTPLWAMMYLRKDDGEEVPVVTFRPPRSHFFSRKAPESAGLEIPPEYHGILDEIMWTYVYYSMLFSGWT